MDINNFRGLLTAVLLVLFVVLCGWLWLGRSKEDFEEAASLPLRDGEAVGRRNGTTDDKSEAK